MSDDQTRLNRRSVLKKSGAAATLLAGGVVGSASAVVGRDHRLLFIAKDGADNASYSATVPNGDLYVKTNEGNDEVDRNGDTAELDGYVSDGFFSEGYDEYKFNGDESDISWSADSDVEVVLEDGSNYGDP